MGSEGIYQRAYKGLAIFPHCIEREAWETGHDVLCMILFCFAIDRNSEYSNPQVMVQDLLYGVTESPAKSVRADSEKSEPADL